MKTYFVSYVYIHSEKKSIFGNMELEHIGIKDITDIRDLEYKIRINLIKFEGELNEEILKVTILNFQEISK